MKLLTITYICIKMCQLFSGRFTKWDIFLFPDNRRKSWRYKENGNYEIVSEIQE